MFKIILGLQHKIVALAPGRKIQEHITEVPYSADVPAIASGSRSLSAQLARNRARWNFGECYDNNNPTLPKSVFAWMTSHTPSL